MSTYQLPRPMPSKLQFGSDTTLGFTDPLKYKTMHSARKPGDSMLGQGDSLPSINSMFKHDPPTTNSPSPLPPSNFDSPRRVPSGSPRRDLPQEQHSYNARQHSDPSLQPTRYVPSHQDASYESRYPRPNIAPYQNHSYRRPEPESTLYAVPLDNARAAYQTPMTTPLSTSYPRYHDANDYGAGSPASLPAHNSQEFPKPLKPARKAIREEHVPGEGMCYIYDDGSHVRKVIDGESVNAQWGVTKAGKPRKRLAVACLTCREKKIKCEPGEDKCTQCEKSGRECSYHQAPRGQQAGQRSPPVEHQARTPSSMSTGKDSYFDSLQSPFADNHAQRLPSPKSPPRRSPSGELLMSKRPRDRSQRNSVDRSHSRRRLEYDLTPESSAPVFPPSHVVRTKREQSFETMRSHTPNIKESFKWTDDPFRIGNAVASDCMDLYFQHVNSATYRMFPTAQFLKWVRDPEMAKSPEELMVIYSMLAMGSLFSTEPRHKAEGKNFNDIAVLANEKSHGRFSLQTAQARLLLSLYHFADGDTSKAWDFCGSACRVIAALKLNIEDEVLRLCSDDQPEFGLRGGDLAECYRRTYWSAFLMDRYNGYSAGYVGILHKEDSFVRLPSSEDFETRGSTSPYLDNGVIDRALCQPDNASLDIMAYLVQISAIWGDVQSAMYRSRQRASQHYAQDYEEFYAKTSSRLHTWAASLPPEIVHNINNIQLHTSRNDIRTFISIHAICHISHIMLNRYVRHTFLSSESIDRNIAATVHHANSLILFMHELLDATRIRRTPSPTMRPSHFKNHNITFSAPFPGYAILVAVDVVTAAGSFEPASYDRLMRYTTNNVTILDEITSFWRSAKIQRANVKRRLSDLTNSALDHGRGNHKVWAMESPLDKTFPVEQDVMYMGDGGKRIFRVLGVDANLRDGDVLWIEESMSREGSEGSAEEEGGPMGKKLENGKGLKGHRR